MEDNIKDQDVLLVKEQGDDRLKVVSGIDNEGKLKTVPPTKQHEPDFMKIDKHSNALENFFSNFMRQAKEPTHFGFFKGSADNIESDALVVGEMLKDPDSPSNKEMLDSVRVNPEDHTAPSQEQTQQTASENTPKPSEGYKPYDESRIDWAQLEQFGITRDTLVKHKALDDMLNYRKSPGLIPLSVKVGDDTLRPEARLSLREMPDGRIVAKTHPIQREPKLDDLFFGHKFSDEDKKALKESGNMGRLAELKFPNRETPVKCLVSIDRLTNEIVPMPADRLRLPNEVKGIKLNDEQKKALAEGKGVWLEGMTAKTGKPFSATVQVNADKRGIEFIFPEKLRQTQKQETAQNQTPAQQQTRTQFKWVDENGNINAPKKLGGVELTSEQRDDFKQGKEIYMQGMLKDGKGRPYNAHIKFNPEKGSPDYDFTNRNQVKESVPANESKTQVAVNTEGKTDEATKHLHDPLQKGQTQPAPAQREEIEQNHEEQKPRTGLRR